MHFFTKQYLLFTFIFFHAVGRCQNNFFTFIKADSTEQCRFFRGGIHYRNTFSDRGFNMNGFYLSAGFNLARFFSKQFIAGICIDIKPFKGISAWQPLENFTTDFNSNFTADNSTPETSFSSTIFYDAFNGANGRYFQGNYFGNIGIQFAPFPQKYGGLLLEIKRGYASFPVYGYSDATIIENGDSDFAFYQVEKIYSGSLYFKPFNFSTGREVSSLERSKSDWKNWIIIGLTYGRMQLTNDYLYGLHLQNVVSSSFWNTYNTQHFFALSLGIGMY